MKQLIFIKKYSAVENILDGLLPEDSHIVRHGNKFAIINLPRDLERKEVIVKLRDRLDEDDKEIIQPVINYAEKGNSIEVTLPNLTFFLDN